MLNKILDLTTAQCQFKENIINAISNGNLNKAIKIMKSKSNNDLPKELILICYDYHSLKTLINLGQLKIEEETFEHRRLVLRILEFLNGSP